MEKRNTVFKTVCGFEVSTDTLDPEHKAVDLLQPLKVNAHMLANKGRERVKKMLYCSGFW